MDIADMLGDAYRYARDAVWGKWKRWILLVVATIIFPLIFGYLYRVLEGRTPPPELNDWIKLFIDGLKLLVVIFIYSIPVWLVGWLVMGGIIGPVVDAFVARDIGAIVSALIAILPGIAVYLILTTLIQLVIYIVLLVAVVRLARTGSIGEAFNFDAIGRRIGTIGWGRYILALVILWLVTIVISAVIGIINLVPIIGWLIVLFVNPPYMIFIARYVSLIHDSAGATL
jgi:hypothetical protein